MKLAMSNASNDLRVKNMRSEKATKSLEEARNAFLPLMSDKMPMGTARMAMERVPTVAIRPIWDSEKPRRLR